MRPTQRGGAWLPPFLAAAAALPGCIIGGDKCGPHQVALEGFHIICGCEPGYVLAADDRSCLPCGPNEEVVNGACACKMGFARRSASEACAASEIAASCIDALACTSPAFPYCARSGTTAEGYCTSTGCTNNAGCPEGWSCERDDAANVRYCRQAPSGIGRSCESSQECAGFEARFCDAILTHACLLAGCATGEATCPNEWSCCDYSALGAPMSICMTASQLVGGACPQGGTLVSR